MGMTYSGSGVNYVLMDAFKRMALQAGRQTAENISHIGGRNDFREFAPSRGESAYLIETHDAFLAHVEEGLGTKNLVADEMYEFANRSYYDNIAQDTVAMIVNDMATLGATPLSVAMHLAAGSSEWFEDISRMEDLVRGWAEACNLAGCTWGGGETPTLRGLVYPNSVVLSGSAMGIIKPKERLIMGYNIVPGDAIVIVESSGIHANGLTLARQIADGLPEGYMTALPDGRTYGETLLDPTHIYVRLVEECLDTGVRVHYAVNITGHGWRKLMRASQPFKYMIHTLPTQLPIFDFIQEHGKVDDAEAYGNLNMGAGFALYLPEKDFYMVREIANEHGLRAFVAGHVESGEKKVVIEPKGIEFACETLAVR